jgi:ATP-dependent Clp protease protease subunit
MQILNRKQLLGRSRPTRSANRIVSVSPSPAVVSCRNWKAFGPTQDHADGDAEYFRLTNQLNQQHEWFAPRPDVSDDDAMEVGPSDSSSTLLQDKRQRPEYGLSMKQISALGLTGNQARLPDPVTLSSRNYLRGEKFRPDQFGYNTVNMAGSARPSRGYSSGPRAAMGDYQTYPEGRPIFLPESERYGNPPDLPSLLLQQRVIYISMPFLPSVTELVVAQCYYLDFDDRNRNKPIYVYLNSTGCINDKGQAISADNEFYAMWAALGFTRAPLYTGVTWKAQNQAAILLAAGQKGHRYSFPHAKISTAPPILNRVFGQAVDAQLQANELVYATKYYAAILARATGKPLDVCQKEYLSRKRYFSVNKAYEEGLIDKLVPGYSLNRFRKLRRDVLGDQPAFNSKEKPKFRFTREST